MKLQNIRIAVGITTSGEPQFLYCGFDSAASLAAVAKAGPSFAEVGALPTGIMPLRPRFPAKEALAALAQAEAKDRAEAAALTTKKTLVEGKVAQARKLNSEAEALQEEILKSENIISPEATFVAQSPKKSKK